MPDSVPSEYPPQMQFSVPSESAQIAEPEAEWKRSAQVKGEVRNLLEIVRQVTDFIETFQDLDPA